MPIYLVTGWTMIQAENEEEARLTGQRLLQNTGWRNGTVDSETIEETDSTSDVEEVSAEDRARWAEWDAFTEGSPIGLRITRQG